jgi:putative membrane protein
MKPILAAAAAAVLVLAVAAPAVHAQTTKPSADKPFVTRAARFEATDVAASKLAAKKGSEPVKALAQRILAAHADLQEEITKLAAGAAGGAAAEPTRRQASVLERLEQLDGRPFDRAYVELIVQDHAEAVALFKQQAELGKDAAAKKLAADALPMLESQLAAAKSLAKKLTTGPTTASTKPGKSGGDMMMMGE